MRVSDAMLFNLSQKRVQQSRSQVASAMEAATTGMRVNLPSQDPLAYALGRRETNRIAQLDASIQGMDESRMFLDGADSALDQAGALLQRSKELAVMMGNGTWSPNERSNVALEARQIREQMIAIANTEVAGRYIFGGYSDGVPPFEGDGTYIGHSDVREIQVGAGLRVATGVAGDVAFGAAGGAGIFTTLDTLLAALEDDDEETIRGLLPDLDAAHTQIVDARAQIGASTNAIEVARSTADRMRLSAISNRSELVEADVAKAYTDVVRAEQALQAAITVASRLPLSSMIGGG